LRVWSFRVSVSERETAPMRIISAIAEICRRRLLSSARTTRYDFGALKLHER
jgi:hypothetical protein